jgi:hypothetical protein
MELDMAMVEEGRYEEHVEYKEFEEFDMFNTDRDIAKEYEEFNDMFPTDRDMYEEYNEFDDMFDTDKDIARRHITLKVEQDHNPQEVPPPSSFTQQWRLYAGCHVGMDVRELQRQLLNYKDGPLEADMYDALGSKIDTLSETEMMEELENLAVEEIVAMISEERQVKQPPVHSS